MLNLQFDHLGIIVKSIAKSVPWYEKLGYEIEGDIFEDHWQQMRGLFLNKKGTPRIELIEDLSDSKVLSKLINSQNGKIYHLAYRVDRLEENLPKLLDELNIRILSPIKPGVFFKNVCFVFSPEAQIIELVEYK